MKHIFSFDMNINTILMEIVQKPELLDLLLNTIKVYNSDRSQSHNFLDVLLGFMDHTDLVVIMSAYNTIELMLDCHINNKVTRQCIVDYLNGHYQDIFNKMNRMIQNENCLVQKYALNILHKLLSLDSESQATISYINDTRNFQLCVNVMHKYGDNSISFAAWHVFKLFITNKAHNKILQDIISRNKEYLIDLVNKYSYKDQHFIQDRKQILRALK